MPHALYQTQGHREYMEDTVDIQTKLYKDYDFYALFDGHGGGYVSTFLKEHFRPVFKEYLMKTSNVVQSLAQTCNTLANTLETDDNAFTTGSTALVMVINKEQVWIMNVGDCRAVLKYFDTVRYSSKQITRDHKPNDDIEAKRIKDVNGFIVQDPFGTWRVGGNLAVARSFGDRYLAPAVTWKPDIYVFNIEKDMRAIFLASDGIWDTISNNDIIAISQNVIENNMSYDQDDIMNKVVKTVSSEAQRKGSGDNITLIFVII